MEKEKVSSHKDIVELLEFFPKDMFECYLVKNSEKI